MARPIVSDPLAGAHPIDPGSGSSLFSNPASFSFPSMILLTRFYIFFVSTNGTRKPKWVFSNVEAESHPDYIDFESSLALSDDFPRFSGVRNLSSPFFLLSVLKSIPKLRVPFELLFTTCFGPFLMVPAAGSSFRTSSCLLSFLPLVKNGGMQQN